MREPIFVPIPEADYHAAVTALLRTMSPMRVDDIVLRLLGDWLEKSCETETEGLKSGRGLLWKTVFIPEGSIIRTHVNGSVYAGKILGNDLVYDGKSFTPAQFANHFGATGRNAWVSLWILFPYARHWRRADACRGFRPSRKNKDE